MFCLVLFIGGWYCLYVELLCGSVSRQKTQLRHSVRPTETECRATARLLKGTECVYPSIVANLSDNAIVSGPTDTV